MTLSSRLPVLAFAGLGGGIVACLFFMGYVAVTSPQALNDGMFGVLFCLTFPPGWLIGSTIAAVWTAGMGKGGDQRTGAVITFIALGCISSAVMAPFIMIPFEVFIGLVIELNKFIATK